MLTILEKKRVKQLLEYFKEVRKKELEENKLILEIIELETKLIKITDLHFYIYVEDRVIVDYEEGKEESIVSFKVKLCRYSGRTLNCPEISNYYLERYLYEPINDNSQRFICSRSG